MRVCGCVYLFMYVIYNMHAHIGRYINFARAHGFTNALLLPAINHALDRVAGAYPNSLDLRLPRAF